MSLEIFPVAALLSVSMAAALLGGIVKNYFCVKISKTSADRQAFNAVTSITAAFVLFLWGGIQSLSVFTLLLGALFGIITALQQIYSLKAMENGPWAYTTVIISLSSLIPALSGACFWGEHIKPAQYVGMAFMVACFILSVNYRGDSKKASLKWLAFCFAAFFCTGFIGVMQKWHQSSDYKPELNAFLVTAFIISFVYSCARWLLLKKPAVKNATGEHRKARRLAIYIFIMSGVCAAVNNKLNLYLSGVMNSAVFFPIVNGGGLVLTAAAAVLLFREKLSARQWAGLAAGILSVLFLSL